MKLNKFSYFLNRKQKVFLWIYLFNQIIISFLELLSLGMIPLFIYYFQNPQLANQKFEKLNEYFDLNIFNNNISEIIFILFIIFIILLILKNVFNILSNYFEAFIIKILNYHNINRLFKYYLYQDIVHFSKSNTAEILRNIISEVPEQMVILLQPLTL